MKGNVVRLLEELLQGYQLHTHRFRLFLRDDGIVTQDGHSEWLRESSQTSTDSAQSYDAKSVFGHVASRKLIALAPFSSLYNAVTKRDLLNQSQKKSQRSLGDCEPTHGGIDHRNLSASRCLNIHRVIACAGSANHPQFRGCFDNPRVDLRFYTPGYNRYGAVEQAQQRCFVGCRRDLNPGYLLQDLDRSWIDRRNR